MKAALWLTRRWRATLAAVQVAAVVTLLSACASTPQPVPASVAPDDGQMLIVAVQDSPETLPAVGATPRLRYGGAAVYAGSTPALALAADLAREHGLAEQGAWTIAALQWRCMLYRLAPGADRAALQATLARDPRVQLAQALNSFETLTGALAPEGAAAGAGAGIGIGIGTSTGTGTGTADPLYDDPYLELQRGFATIKAGPAQRFSRGEGVRVALIDTAVDSQHPDLAGRIVKQRDFGGSAHPAAAGGEAHGTQMAGVIAAVANNRLGIAGVAPQARLLAYRACWPAPGGITSHCNSFTLAQALGAAIADGSDIINLSLGGPADPLLQRLLEHAIAGGAIVVAALPPGGRPSGFPVGVRGVLAVASSDEAGNGPHSAFALSAPGADILTLAPSGGYGYATGSSMAAAHVSGAVALLRALRPGLRGALAQAWLAGAGGGPIDLCRALSKMDTAAACSAASLSAPSAPSGPAGPSTPSTPSAPAKSAAR